MGQTVNLLVFTFGGSNPSLPTRKKSAGWSCKLGRQGRERLRLFLMKEGGLVKGCLYLVDAGKPTLMRYVFAEVAQLIEH